MKRFVLLPVVMGLVFSICVFGDEHGRGDNINLDPGESLTLQGITITCKNGSSRPEIRARTCQCEQEDNSILESGYVRLMLNIEYVDGTSRKFELNSDYYKGYGVRAYGCPNTLCWSEARDKCNSLINERRECEPYYGF